MTGIYFVWSYQFFKRLCSDRPSFTEGPSSDQNCCKEKWKQEFWQLESFCWLDLGMPRPLPIKPSQQSGVTWISISRVRTAGRPLNLWSEEAGLLSCEIVEGVRSAFGNQLIKLWPFHGFTKQCALRSPSSFTLAEYWYWSEAIPLSDPTMHCNVGPTFWPGTLDCGCGVGTPLDKFPWANVEAVTWHCDKGTDHCRWPLSVTTVSDQSCTNKGPLIREASLPLLVGSWNALSASPNYPVSTVTTPGWPLTPRSKGTDQSGTREASMPSLASGVVTHMAVSAFALTTGLEW